MSDDQGVLLVHDGPVSVLTINRPALLNALNLELLVALERRVGEVRARVETRSVIVTGAGDRAFVAGADIAGMRGMGADDAERFARQGHAAFDALAALPSPVIAAVNGFALGGGCELALACDFIYASERAKFGQPEVNLGIIPGFGGTQRLSRRVGAGIARELIYTGALIDAQEALRIGLVNRVVPADQLLVEAKKTALLIAQKGPLALRMAKRVISEGLDHTLREGAELEVEAFAACFRSEDRAEGVSAFLDKRSPSFKGR